MKKLFLTGAAALMAIAMGSIQIHAAARTQIKTATAKDQDVPITYDNRNIVDGGSGIWGVVIPTAVSFSDTSMTSNTSIELQGINGYSLADLGDNLKVQVTLASKNGYQLQLASDNTKYATYSATYGTTVLDEKNKASKQIAELTKATAKQAGTTQILNKQKASTKGTYTDTLTYAIAHTGDDLK